MGSLWFGSLWCPKRHCYILPQGSSLSSFFHSINTHRLIYHQTDFFSFFCFWVIVFGCCRLHRFWQLYRVTKPLWIAPNGFQVTILHLKVYFWIGFLLKVPDLVLVWHNWNFRTRLVKWSFGWFYELIGKQKKVEVWNFGEKGMPFISVLYSINFFVFLMWVITVYKFFGKPKGLFKATIF